MLFLSILFFVGSSLSNATVNNGLYDVDFSSNTAPTSSEVTTPVVEQSSVPAPQASTLTSIPIPPSRPTTEVAAATTPAAPAAPARDYTVRSAGRRANQENLVDVRSCGSITFISGPKVDGNRNDCDTLTTAETFVETLMRQLPLCAAEGARASGITKPIQKVKIFNAGSLRTTPRPSGNLSLHYKARALDIWHIDVIFTDNSTLKVPMTVDSKNRPFYKKFNDCWERETVATMRRLYPNNRRCHSYDGLIDCSRSDHRDHVHVSLPYCPKKSGYNSY